MQRKNLNIRHDKSNADVSVIAGQKFDYTKWQRDFFDKMSNEEIDKKALEYADCHPYEGNAKIII